MPDLPVCYADLLAVAHGDSSKNHDTTLTLLAEKLQSARLGNITVLPAFRSRSRWNTLEIRPEHLNNRTHPFLVTELLTRLGEKLGVDAVVIDLRAGLELSAGLILDPRIHRVFVTSTSGQAITGTEELFKILGCYAPAVRDNYPAPWAIISLVPKEIPDLPEQTGEQRLEQALKNFGEPVNNIIITTFDENLLSLPLDWNEIMERLNASRILGNLTPLRAIVEEQDAPAIGNQDAKRKQLEALTGRMEYAEAGGAEGFLKTAPLRRLAEDHRTKLPRILMMGAKGAGKTFTFLQLAALGTWRAFLTDVLSTEDDFQDARLLPFLYPKNLSGDSREILVTAEAIPNGHDEALSETDIRDRIRNEIQKADKHEGEWRDFWLDCFAWRSGLGKDQEGKGQELAGAFAQENKTVIYLIDGLEDLFQDIASNKNQQKALRALVQDVPEWLAQHPVQSVGVIMIVATTSDT